MSNYFKEIDGEEVLVRDCPECEGKTEVKCICSCGNEHDNICETCNGEGYVIK